MRRALWRKTLSLRRGTHASGVTDEELFADDTPDAAKSMTHGRLTQMQLVSCGAEASEPFNSFDNLQKVQVDESFDAHSNIHIPNMSVYKIQFAAWLRQDQSSERKAAGLGCRVVVSDRGPA